MGLSMPGQTLNSSLSKDVQRKSAILASEYGGGVGHAMGSHFDDDKRWIPKTKVPRSSTQLPKSEKETSTVVIN